MSYYPARRPYPSRSYASYSRSYSRYPTYTRRSAYYKPRTTYSSRRTYGYGFPPARGNAVVNGDQPELKSYDLDSPHFPVSSGDLNPAATPITVDPTAGTYWDAWDNKNGADNPNSIKTGFITCVNGVGGGSLLNQRIGRKINLKSILVRVNYRIKNPGNDEGFLANPVFVRSMLVWDKCPNASAPKISDILQPTPCLGQANLPAPSSNNNLDNRDRFRTLWDAMDSLSPGGDSLRVYDKYIKLSGETVYNSNNEGIGGITTGALYLVLLSDAFDTTQENTNYAQYRPLVKFITRVRYTDS